MKGITAWDAPVAISAEQLETLKGLIHQFGEDTEREERVVTSIGNTRIDSLDKLDVARYDVLVQRLQGSNKKAAITRPCQKGIT
tara:strand:- start:7 stop:258 length:252 start_codon:yes stop_codon:yes gene_type:complete